MLNIFKYKILDDLYNARGDGFETNYIKNFGKNEKLERTEITENQLDNAIELVKDEETKQEIIEKLGEFQDSVLGEMCFWFKQYYKLGFLDCINFKTEIRSLKKKFTSESNIDNSNITDRDTFFNNYLDDFLDYFESQKTRRLNKRAEYIELQNKIKKIKNSYPNVRLFIEDEEINKNLNIEELKAVLEIIDIENNINALEVEEAFILGLKENEML